MFITFEGLDFSGKTTQATRFVERVKADAQGSVLFLREPGGTRISERIREILLDREHLEMSPMAELLLFSASRSQLVQEVILPALGRGETVVCDRFYDSTTAYQGYGRGLDLQAIGRINAIASAGLVPDLTIFVDIPIEEIGRRKTAAGVPFDRMESGGGEFYRARALRLPGHGGPGEAVRTGERDGDDRRDRCRHLAGVSGHSAETERNMKLFPLTSSVRSKLLIPAGAVIFLIASGFLPPADSDLFLKINRGINLFGRVYKEVAGNYVDEVDPEKFMQAGIEGMLGMLDPYTVFIDREDGEEVDLMTSGKYGGIGVTIGVRDGAVRVITVMDGYSAQRQG